MNYLEIVNKLIGPVSPAGESHLDSERFENLKAMIELTEGLLNQIHRVSMCKMNHQHSMKKAGEEAQKFIDQLKDYE